MSLAQALAEAEEYRKYNKLYYYEPYPFQKAFHHAREGKTYEWGQYEDPGGVLAIIRAIIAANQVGKTYPAGFEVGFHTTGEYPDWWKGHVFKKPVNWLIAGKTNDTVRDVCQKELFGNPEIREEFGCGAIPRNKVIGKPTRKAGVPNAFSTLKIRHKSGGISSLQFMAYEQGPDAFMGRNIYDGAWCDEEPPADIWAQILRCFFAVDIFTILMTFNPEEGWTDLVDGFMTNLGKGESLIKATWDDAPHMTPEAQELFLKKVPPHQRELRSKGIPVVGSGLVFPINEEEIVIDPIPIPRHWRRVSGIDFGIAHPFAWAGIAHDTENDVVHLYDDYRVSGAIPAIHCSAIKNKPNSSWIPIIWPHDGLNRDKGSGIPLADIYRDEGLKTMRRDKFTNPPGPGQKEGQGGNGVEVGLLEMWQRMETGRFKVHRNCINFLSEIRQYHRKDGIIQPKKDDTIDAARIAVMSLRWAITEPVARPKTIQIKGSRNW